MMFKQVNAALSLLTADKLILYYTLNHIFVSFEVLLNDETK